MKSRRSTLETTQKSFTLCGLSHVVSALLLSVSFSAKGEDSRPFQNSNGVFSPPGQGLPQDWAGIRALGMGNAFTTVGNDELSVFSNPAGLARSRNPRKKSQIHEGAFPNFALGLNEAAVSALGAPNKPSLWPEPMRKASVKKEGTLHYAEAQAFPYVTLGGRGSPTFLIGFPGRSEMSILSRESKTLLASETTVSAALAVSGTTRAGLFTWGLAARPNLRYSALTTELGEAELTAAALKTFGTKEGVRTSGVPLDAGILVTAADFWFPTLGLSVRNIPTGCKQNYVNPSNGKTVEMCGTLRQKVSGEAPTETHSGKPLSVGNTEVDPTEFRAGFSITPRGRIDGTKINLRLALDVFPIPIQQGSKQYGITDTSVPELIHAGAELFFGNAMIDKGLAIRGGFQNSLPTYGATVELFGLSLEFAHYSVRTGIGSLKKIDKRYLAGLSVAF